VETPFPHGEVTITLHVAPIELIERVDVFGVVGEHLLRDVQDVPPHDLREPAAGQERDSGGLPLRSVALPLFGAGRGGLDARKSAEAVLGALEIALAADPDWPVHLVTRNPVSAAAVLEALAARRR
jgi:hypothetical protein